MKRLASTGPTRAPVLALVASGRARSNRRENGEHGSDRVNVDVFFFQQVMSHLMQVHKSITTLQGEDIVFLATDINLPGAVDWVMMQSCFGHHFM